MSALKDGADADVCEIELSDAVPSGIKIGKKVGALIETGELKDVVCFARPAGASSNN